MAQTKQKFYVVWVGLRPGIYESWEACSIQVTGVADARYKSYATKHEAEQAFMSGPPAPTRSAPKPKPSGLGKPEYGLCVDAAWNTVTGWVEYRGVVIPEGIEVFKQGPYPDGTNNIVEFLALVHGIAWCKKHNQTNMPIYSDSQTAIGWVKRKKANSKHTFHNGNEILKDLLERAEQWLSANAWSYPLHKWDTKNWGEIPADFGRK